VPWSWHSAKSVPSAQIPSCTRQRSPLPSVALGKMTKNSIFYLVFTFHHDKQKISHIYHIHHIIYHIYLTSIIYSHPSHNISHISHIHHIIYHIYHNKSITSSKQVHHSCSNITSASQQVYHKSKCKPEMQIQVRLTTIITKLATETVVKEKLDHSEAHELDYSNPPIEVAQRRRHCMCETRNPLGSK
jgi:hypothetical protein